MLNLEVDVRLRDGVTRPAREATESIKHFGAAAQRVARRVAGLASAVREQRRPTLHSIV